MKSTVSCLGAWLAAVGLAIALAFVAPNETSVMGRLPAFMAHTLLRQPVAVPAGLPSDRTLALITFQRGQRTQVESWIEGLNLRNDSSIAWMRMPVLNDPGTLTGRSAVEDKLLRHYPDDAERARLVPVFTDRASFVRSAGLNGIEQVYAVVVNRQGEVLARVEGQFDPDKAQALRETLQAHDL
ncbi:MAG: hypothetical protein ACREXN_04315 [Polaromonas sp.]